MQGKHLFFEQAKYTANITHQYNPFLNKPYSDGRHPDTKHQISGYGESHLQGRRESQQDGSFFVQSSNFCTLTPQQVAERLWSAIKIADALVKNEGAGQDEGTTACVAFLHQGHLVTANLADSVIFALLLNINGELLGVTRLTENLHHPDEPNELNRIQTRGGKVLNGRVNDELAITRAIGDYKYNVENEVVIADSSVSIYSLNQIQMALNPDNKPAGELKFIMTCDGFTEAADELKMAHHEYLANSFQTIKDRTFSIEFNESYLALALARKALDDGSRDNISISVLTYDPKITNPLYFAIFDGHGGIKVLDCVLTNFVSIFNEQLALTEENYKKQSLSTHNNKDNFLRDNDPIVKMVIGKNVVINEQKEPSEIRLLF